MILAVANQKGGVGKTTSAITLAAIWAAKEPVLLVDMDPQGNAASGLGLDETDLDLTVSEVLRGEAEIRDAILKTGVEGLDILPSDIGLAALEADGLPVDALARALEARLQKYARIVIDCPPSLGYLTLCSLAASDRVLVPIRAGRFSLLGLRQLLATIDNLRVRGVNPSLRPLGIFFNESQTRTNLYQRTEEAVRELYGDLVLETSVPSNVALGEAVTVGEPITQYAPDASGATAFRALAEEVERAWHRVVRIG